MTFLLLLAYISAGAQENNSLNAWNIQSIWRQDNQMVEK